MLYTVKPPLSFTAFVVLLAWCYAFAYALSYFTGWPPEYDHINILFTGIIFGMWMRETK